MKIGLIIVCCTVSQATKLSSGCTYSQGYWKTMPLAELAVPSMFLGCVEYSTSEIQKILNTPVRSNGLISLAHQLIAAILNVNLGASSPDINEQLYDALDIIGEQVIPPFGNGFIHTKLVSVLVDNLEAFNEGKAGPPHCKDSVTTTNSVMPLSSATPNEFKSSLSRTGNSTRTLCQSWQTSIISPDRPRSTSSSSTSGIPKNNQKPSTSTVKQECSETSTVSKTFISVHYTTSGNTANVKSKTSTSQAETSSSHTQDVLSSNQEPQSTTSSGTFLPNTILGSDYLSLGPTTTATAKGTISDSKTESNSLDMNYYTNIETTFDTPTTFVVQATTFSSPLSIPTNLESPGETPSSTTLITALGAGTAVVVAAAAVFAVLKRQRLARAQMHLPPGDHGAENPLFEREAKEIDNPLYRFDVDHEEEEEEV
jgi:uncharacterized membrane protein